MATWFSSLKRGKTYGSVRLRKKKSKGTLPIPDRAIEPWTMSTEDLSSKSFAPPEEGQTSVRNSVLQERDVFLELLSKVQDNRYENQRYTLKAGSVNDPEESNNDDVFDESGYRNGHDEADTITVSSSFTNGVLGSTSPELLPPSIEVSPESTLQKPRHSVSLDDLDIIRDEVRQSFSPPPLMAGSASTPGRRSMAALKRMMECEGPYPLLIESPDGGYWVQNGEYESAKGEDDMWTAPEISTEHYTVQCDLTALAYGGHFCGQEHSNYIARDPNVGPVLLSIKFEKDYQGTQVRAILRTQSDTIYKVFPDSQLLSNLDIPDYIRYVSADKITTDKVFKIELPKAAELIRKFDEHPVAKTHKIGVIHQHFEQTSEEEIFGNVKHSESLDEFLTMLGSKVTLKGFEGYRGGLDVNNDQTGEQSVHTVYKDREIMFHVSTLLPHDDSDPQHVQKKRHIGNDIVVVVFQEENTPFCPSAIRSHFIHSYIAVQVEHPNTDHTVYKVAVTAKDDVPQFGPPLPDPAVFQKGPDFREWLLTKILNAEFNCHMAPSFKKLANRTRAQLFLHLVEEIAQTMDDVDYPSLIKGMTSLASGSEMNSVKTRRRRRRTLGGIFNKKESPQNSLSTKRKSLAADPSRQIYRKLRSEPSSPREMVVGSTPDLASASIQKEHSPSDYTVMINGRPSVGHATPDLAELSRVDVKGKPRNRFTTKKADSEDRKRPKRTKSFGGAAGFSDYFRKRKEPTSPVIKHSMKRDSSEDSSIASSLNWSVPYDLPSVVEAEIAAKRQHERLKAEHRPSPDRTKSNPTILERKESDLSISDVCLTLPGKPKMADAAVQVTPYDWSNPYLNSFTSAGSPQNEFRVLNPGHRKSMSLQNTPKILRRSGDSSSRYEISPKHNDSLNGEVQRQSESEKRRLEDILKNIQFRSSNSLEQRASSEDREDMVIRRAESIDSISTDVGELYDSVLQSLQSLTDDVVRLREHNVVLSTENIKFASQNSRLKDKHRMMKKQLTITQKQINTLQLKLRLYQPNFTLEDEVEVTSV
ncbi:rap1 GTPase-activating protein 1-like isoform X3 [Halichondria panicea]|uniref:rap1 GTPase-activating protein 1-like isoform X3 n=1 Tax=Halichondria panicea TaxID=6063 RepID=UPI00312B78F9